MCLTHIGASVSHPTAWWPILLRKWRSGVFVQGGAARSDPEYESREDHVRQHRQCGNDAAPRLHQSPLRVCSLTLLVLEAAKWDYPSIIPKLIECPPPYSSLYFKFKLSSFVTWTWIMQIHIPTALLNLITEAFDSSCTRLPTQAHPYAVRTPYAWVNY